MNFNLEKDLNIFDDFFKKRPEVNSDQLKQNLKNYYLPYVTKLLALKKVKTSTDGIIIGVSAIQGAGKTTQGEILEILLKHLGFTSVSRSIDDHYITHPQLCDLRKQDPRFIRRGVTHDIPLAILDLSALQKMSELPILVSGYDKGAHHGDGDRFRWVNLSSGIKLKASVINQLLVVDKELKNILSLKLTEVTYNDHQILLSEKMGSLIPIIEPLLSKDLVDFLTTQSNQTLTVEMSDQESIKFSGSSELIVSKKTLPNAWRLIEKKPDFIFYDGWMLGARMVEDEAIFSAGLPALEKSEDQEFAKMVNKKLENYYPLWQMFEFLNVLYVKNYQMSLKWRDQAEETLRAKGGGMTSEQIIDFVHYFWRSVHPGIHIKNLAQDTIYTNQVVIINDDHSVGELYTPEAMSQLE
jgi:pantothenate kinase-related protein Tda10